MARSNIQGKLGLQHSYLISKTCERCTVSLDTSKINDYVLVYCIGRAKYICMTCALGKTGFKQRCTNEDVDLFLNRMVNRSVQKIKEVLQ